MGRKCNIKLRKKKRNERKMFWAEGKRHAVGLKISFPQAVGP